MATDDDVQIVAPRLARERVVRAYTEAPTQRDQIAVLLEGLRSPDPIVRQTCAIRAGCLGSAGLACAELLREIANGDDIHPVRSWAAFALARAGDVGGGMAVLTALLVHERWEVRSHAAIALSALGPDIPADAIPGLVAALADPSENVRWAVVWALGEVGPAARSALSVLRGLRADPSAPVRLAVSASMEKIQDVEGGPRRPEGNREDPGKNA